MNVFVIVAFPVPSNPTATLFRVHPLITACFRLIVPSSITLTPINSPQSVPWGPLMVNPFIVTSAPLLTSTMYGRPITLGSSSSNGGASIMVDSAPEPMIVIFLLIVSCSV